MTQEFAVKLDGVTKSFGTRRVLDNITLEIPSGCGFIILGRSGTGKSVTLRHIIGLVTPDSGRVFVEGADITELHGTGLAAVRKQIGFLFQSAALFDSISVGENVAFPMRRHTRLHDGEIRERARAKLEAVGLGSDYDKMPADLSGGMRKRAGLARAMALDPKVLFYDEPSAGLDPVTSAEIDQLIIDLNKKLGITSVVVTHEMDSAFRIADRMVLLDRGKFIVSGTAEEMRQSTDPLVRQFVDGLTEGPLTERRKLAGGYEDDLMDDQPQGAD